MLIYILTAQTHSFLGAAVLTLAMATCASLALQPAQYKVLPTCSSSDEGEPEARHRQTAQGAVLHFAGVLQAVSAETQGPNDGPPSDAVSRTLHVQAAKVVAAHAASMGDSLLGVPLMCSAGGQLHKMALCVTGPLHGEAVRLPSPSRRCCMARCAPGCDWQPAGDVPSCAWQIVKGVTRRCLACFRTSTQDTASPSTVAAAADVPCHRHRQILHCQHAV